MINNPPPAIKRGHFFIFEGPDGVGKTTIVNKLAVHMRKQGINVLNLSFPGNIPGTLGNLIYRVHHEPKMLGVKKISSTSLQTLHIAAHIDCIENQIIPALYAGTTVLLDRYWWSTMAYGLANSVPKNALYSMIELEKHFWKELLPDQAFLITRNKSFNKELTEEQWTQISQNYEMISRQESQYYCVNKITNTNSIDMAIAEIMKSIMNSIHKKLPESKMTSNSKKYKTDQWAPTKTTPVFDSYWNFAAKRQEIFFKRIQGLPPPWTDDSILQTYKFTNAYRASDRVSQYLIKHVIYEGDQSPDEVFFRIILFKMFNKIETWELLKRELKEIRYEGYNFKYYDNVLTTARNNKETIYSAAYIMPSGGNCFGYNVKHQNNLKLLESMMKNDLPNQICDAKSMQDVFILLRDYPMIGDFLAYQYTIDINYSELTNFNEMSFVLPGPGAKDGLRKCFSDFGGLSEIDLIRLMAERQQDEFAKRNIKFKNLWGRSLQLIDCQNLFCEVDKYSRIAHPDIKGLTGRLKIKQKYRLNPTPISYYYPPKWKINNAVNQTLTQYKNNKE